MSGSRPQNRGKEITAVKGTRAGHWSVWVIGAVGLLYNLAGVINFLTQMNPESVAAMPEIYRSVLLGRPVWATAGFALAVFGGALGCLALLLRKAAARGLLIGSLLGAMVTLVHALGVAPGAFVIGNLVQLLVTALLIVYATYAATRKWLG